jgi:protoporphyrinogen oxidase
MVNTLFRTRGTRSLINEFHYPILGPGMMWQRFTEDVDRRGGKVNTGQKVIGIEHDRSRVRGLVTVSHDGKTRMGANHVISSMPLPELVRCLNPVPPDEVVRAARGLRYRDFLVVALMTERTSMFPDQWIYMHSPDVRVGRIQNFGNWSSAMVPDPQTSSLGMEYFCDEGDELWQMPDNELIALAERELVKLGLARMDDIKDGVVVRQPKAYPIYDGAYRSNLETVRRFLETLENLQTVGRNGMHRYNNMDHSMLTGMLAVRNLLGQGHDLWAVNVEQVYHEANDEP